MATDKSVMAVIRASRPSFRNAHDKVAFAVHATFVASGYFLTATGKPAFSDTTLSSTSTDEVGIEQWNEIEDEYAFVYCNPEKGSKKVLVKCLVMNDKLLVAALADGASEPMHNEISVEDFVFAGNGGTNYSGQFKDLDRFVMTLDKEILSKLDGSSDKPTSSQTRAEQKQNLNEPGIGAAEPQHTQSYPSGLVYPPVGPIGSSDLFPGPGAGMYPPRGDFGGDGMLLGPDDPRWFGGVGRDPSFPGGLLGVPPGARFDPYGPPGVPGFEPNRFTRVPRRPGGGTHPDSQHFGSGTDF